MSRPQKSVGQERAWLVGWRLFGSCEPDAELACLAISGADNAAKGRARLCQYRKREAGKSAEQLADPLRSRQRGMPFAMAESPRPCGTPRV